MDKIVEPHFHNNRKYIRFIRSDILVSLVKTNILGLKETIVCKLIDISSSGIQISTQSKLSINSQYILYLQFYRGNRFNIKAKIIHHKKNEYYLSNHSFTLSSELIQNPPVKIKSLHLYQSDTEISAKYRHFNKDNIKILTDTALKKNHQCELLLLFEDKSEQSIKTKFNSILKIQENLYGLKFEKTNEELGDYLFETEQKLVFKH